MVIKDCFFLNLSNILKENRSFDADTSK